MAPADPADTPSPLPEGEPVPSPVTTGRAKRRTVRILVVAAAAVIVIAGVGVTGALVAYERAAEPDRSTPQVSTRGLFAAILVDHDEGRAALFLCPQLTVGEASQAIIVSKDQGLLTNWAVLSSEESGNSARAVVRVRSLIGEFRQVDVYRIELVNSGGWRVCSIMRDNSLNPN